MSLTDLAADAHDAATAAIDRATDTVRDAVDRATDAVTSTTETLTPATTVPDTAGAPTVRDRMTRIARHTAATIGLTALTMSQSALAQPENCTVPSGLQPVFDLLNAITQATAAVGIAAATLGIVIAGIFYMWPGADMNRRAKSIILTTIGGVAIILLANGIVQFVTTNMGNTVCTQALLALL